MKAKTRERLHPHLGKMDIDYKASTPPPPLSCCLMMLRACDPSTTLRCL